MTNNRLVWSIIFVILVALALFFVFSNSNSGSDTPRACFENGVCLNLEIADSPAERAQGVMFRESLPSDSGMLFVFEAEGEYAFWMKNTKIPLDIIWLDSNYRIVGIKENVAPCSADPCPTHSIGVPAQFVLETNAGIVQQNLVEAGQEIKIFWAGV